MTPVGDFTLSFQKSCQACLQVREGAVFSIYVIGQEILSVVQAYGDGPNSCITVPPQAAPVRRHLTFTQVADIVLSREDQTQSGEKYRLLRDDVIAIINILIADEHLGPCWCYPGHGA